MSFVSGALMKPIVDEPRREERRARILGAAARVFSRRPFAVASMDDIAHEAGVGKPTLYRYFAGKEELFAAVFAEVLDHLEHRLDRALALDGGTERRLVALATEIVPLFREHLVSHGLVDESAAADLSKRRAFRERQARIAARLAAALEAGMRQGEVRELDARRIGHLLIGLIWSGAAASGEAPAREVAQEVVDLVLNGLAIRPDLEEPWPAAGREASRPEVIA